MSNSKVANVTSQRQPIGPLTPSKSDREALACEIYVAMLGGHHWDTSKLEHVAGQAILAAATFYEVFDNAEN